MAESVNSDRSSPDVSRSDAIVRESPSRSSRITRRTFLGAVGAPALAGLSSPATADGPSTGPGVSSTHRTGKADAARSTSVLLGGPVFAAYDGPDEWIRALDQLGYQAAYCPVGPDADEATIRAYEEAAASAGVTIAEVGSWSNPISPNADQRAEALATCRRHLHLADRIGANCCVNISGSRNPQDWAGPHEDNLTAETFDLIVQTTRSIIDEVQPRRTYFTLETMPWAYPDSPESYLRLLEAIDRDRFAVHCDPVNIVTSPRRYYENGDLIERFFSLLGPYIKSCHGKDVVLENQLTTHLSETRPGTGGLDYETYLRELNRLDGVPLMLEHLDDAATYRRAAEHVRTVAADQELD